MPNQPAKRRGRPPVGGRQAILAAALELLRERGVARLTTREVARLASVSEGSVFYHYRDRTGLLQAVFEEGLAPLQALADGGRLTGRGVREVMARLGPVLERFLDQTLPIISAAQSDTELRDALALYMSEHDLGPHRGVHALGAYIADEQTAGRVRPDVDPQAIALTFVGACFIGAWQRQMPLHKVTLPPLEDVITALDTSLHTAASDEN